MMKFKLTSALLGAFFIILLFSGDVSDEYPNASPVHFDEITVSFQKLVEQSDVIVGCVFNGKKETRLKYSEVLVAPVTKYKMKRIEVLKGAVDKEFTMSLLGGPDPKIQKGKEYVLFLRGTPEDTYCLVSYRQGLLETVIKTAPSEAQTTGEAEPISYIGIKKMIAQQFSSSNPD